MSDNLFNKIKFNQQYSGAKGGQKDIKCFFNNCSYKYNI